ncbi:MAG TPA: CHAD domain-containing protein [Streptosporangiaceae bacterium]
MATGRCREFVIEGDARTLARRIATALEPRFSIVQETRRRERQVWLDTFDWRLHSAGLVLRQLSMANGHSASANGARRPGELVLTTAGGEQVASAPLGAPRWPALLGAIPAGALRDRLDPVAGVRALLPLARAEGTMTLLRVLDGEHKTVARIWLEVASLARPAGRTLPARLVLTPVRGYQPDTDRAARLLAAADGFAPSSRAVFQTVLASAGRQPGDYRDKVAVTLPASAPARAAVASVLLGLADTIEANVGFVIRDVDIEFLHDLRVAVRRTRSALKLAGDVLPGGTAARFAAEFKWLGDLTTPTRDLDVHLTGFDDLTGRLRAAAPADLEPLRAQLAQRRAAERRKLLRGLRSARFAELMTAWRAALEAAAGRPGRGRQRGPDIGSLAARRIGRAYRRAAKRGAAISATGGADGPPAEDMHALRKRCKELRYLLEFFGPLYEPAALRRAVKDLKGLQDCLGEFQDAEVQRDEIREFATQMLTPRAAPRGRRQSPPAQPAAGELAGTELAGTELAATELAATLLAMGELTAQLDGQQRRARADVAGRFAGFAGAGVLDTLGIGTRTARP